MLLFYSRYLHGFKIWIKRFQSFKSSTSTLSPHFIVCVSHSDSIATFHWNVLQHLVPKKTFHQVEEVRTGSATIESESRSEIEVLKCYKSVYTWQKLPHFYLSQIQRTVLQLKLSWFQNCNLIWWRYGQ